MHRRTALPPEHPRVLAHLEPVFPAARSAADLAAARGLSVPAAPDALESLRLRGRLRFGPGAPDGTPATAVYEAVRKPPPSAAAAAGEPAP